MPGGGSIEEAFEALRAFEHPDHDLHHVDGRGECDGGERPTLEGGGHVGLRGEALEQRHELGGGGAVEGARNVAGGDATRAGDVAEVLPAPKRLDHVPGGELGSTALPLAVATPAPRLGAASPTRQRGRSLYG